MPKGADFFFGFLENFAILYNIKNSSPQAEAVVAVGRASVILVNITKKSTFPSDLENKKKVHIFVSQDERI